MRVCEVCKRCYSDDVELCSTENHAKLTELSAFGPDVIAGYKIVQLLFSSTGVNRFRATQAATKSDCMIAIISLANESVDQFLSEAKLAASILHPAMSTVYEYGVLDSGEGFLVSEYSARRSVKDLLQDGAPQLLTSIQIVEQTADALDLLHSSGLVHGAIRPENILICESEGQLRVKLQHPDLAAASRNRVLSNKLTLDASGDVLQYLAPEQLVPGSNEQSGDIYSLGVVLYELLSGSPPFTGESAAEVIEKQRNEHAPEIKIPNYEIRMLLANALMESLQKQPLLRLPSALAFARQMRHIEQLATHSSTPPPVMNAPRLKSKSAAASASFQPQQLADEGVLRALKPIAAAPKKIEPAEVELLLEESSITSSALAPDKENVAAIRRDGEKELNRSRLTFWKEKYSKHVGKLKGSKTSEQRWDSILNLEGPAKRASVIAAPPPVVERKEGSPERKRIKIEWQQPADDVPTMDDVRKTLASSPTSQPAIPAKAAAVEMSDFVNENADQSPIKRTIQKSLNDFPGMFSFVDRRQSLETSSRYASIISALSIPSFMRSIDRRVFIAGIATVFILGILFAGFLISGNEEHAATVEPARPEEITLPPAPVEPSRQTAVQVSEPVEDVPTFMPNARSAAPLNEKDVRAVKTKADEPEAKPSPNVTTAARSLPAKISADVVTAPAASSALKPSTLVISASNGRVDKRVESPDTAAPKRTPSNQNNGAGATRPRVVANPKP